MRSSSQGSAQPLSPGGITGIVLGVVAVMAMLSILWLRRRTRNKTSQGVIEPFNSKVAIKVDRSNRDRDSDLGMVINTRFAGTELMERDQMANGPPESPPPYSLLDDPQSTAFRAGTTGTTRTGEARASTVMSQMWSSPKRSI